MTEGIKLPTDAAAGTPVFVRRDDGDILATVTRSEPRQLGHYAWVVAVDGIAGSYALDRVFLDVHRCTSEQLEPFAQAVYAWSQANAEAQEPEIRALCERMGYGRVIQAASNAWNAKCRAEGMPEDGHMVGACKALTVPCVCRVPPHNREVDHCDWCCGAGWLTEHTAGVARRLAKIVLDNGQQRYLR